jgi:serine/threonine protein phosphatase PrpC
MGREFESVKGVTIHQSQGPRDYQEDRVVVFERDHYVVMGLFDGHNGSSASELCATILPLEFDKLYTPQANMVVLLNQVVAALESEFMAQVDPKASEVTLAFTAGTTLEIVVYDRSRQMLFVANLGDSRTILVKKDSVVQVSTDHSWRLQSERDRIKTMTDANVGVIGSRIMRSMGRGAKSQCHSLEVSRAIGDPFFKPWVSSTPEIHVTQCDSDCHSIVVVSDGVSNGITNDEVGNLARQFTYPAQAIASAQTATKSGDNASAIVYVL